MAHKGGYQIVDLRGESLSGTAVTIPGTYEKIEGTRKPILLTNINKGGTEIHNSFVSPLVSSSNFLITLPDGSGEVITITPDDEITIGN